jgi:hypothetical protein
MLNTPQPLSGLARPTSGVAVQAGLARGVLSAFNAFRSQELTDRKGTIDIWFRN